MSAERQIGQSGVHESAARHLVKHATCEPFPKALRELAESRGFQTQTQIADAIGVFQSSISNYFLGEHTPNPETFGKFLALLRPTDAELDPLANSWGQLISEGRGISSLAHSGTAIANGRNLRRSSDTPVGKWIEDFCDKRDISLGDFYFSLDYQSGRGHNRNELGLPTLSNILENVPTAFNLDVSETVALAEAVAATIETKISEGHRYNGNFSTESIQKKLPYATYNLRQAGEKLGVTKQRVHELRVRYGLPMLMTDKDLDLIRASVGQRPNTKIAPKASIDAA